MSRIRKYFLSFFILTGSLSLSAQDTIGQKTPGQDTSFRDSLYMEPNFTAPKSYKLLGVEYEGLKGVAINYVWAATGLLVSQSITIPGEEIPRAIENLWKMKYFPDIKVYVKKI